MRQRTKVLTGVGVGAVVVAGTVVLVGPGLYADWADRNAEQAPTLDPTVAADDAAAGQGESDQSESGPSDPGDDGGSDESDSAGSSLDGEWTAADGSYAGYRVHEILRGASVDVTGRTEEVDATVVVEDDTLTAASVEVDMASVATDQPNRDSYFRDTALEVGTYPTATFEATEPVELPDGETTVELVGDLTIHGVTRNVTVDAEFAPGGDQLQVVGTTPITFADFDVEAPDLGFVQVDEDGEVEINLRLEPAA